MILVFLAIPTLGWLAVGGAALIHLFLGHQRAFSGLVIATLAGFCGTVLSLLTSLIPYDALETQQMMWIYTATAAVGQFFGALALVGILVAIAHPGPVDAPSRTPR